MRQMRNVFEAILKYGHDEDFVPDDGGEFVPTEVAGWIAKEARYPCGARPAGCATLAPRRPPGLQRPDRCSSSARIIGRPTNNGVLERIFCRPQGHVASASDIRTGRDALRETGFSSNSAKCPWADIVRDTRYELKHVALPKCRATCFFESRVAVGQHQATKGHVRSRPQETVSARILAVPVVQLL